MLYILILTYVSHLLRNSNIHKSLVFLQPVNFRHNTVILITLLTVNKKTERKKQGTN